LFHLNCDDSTSISTFQEVDVHRLPDEIECLAPPLHLLFGHSHFTVIYPPGQQPPTLITPTLITQNPNIFLSDIIASYDKDIDNPQNKHHSKFLTEILTSPTLPYSESVDTTLAPFFHHLSVLQEIDPNISLMGLLSLTTEGCKKLQSRLTAPIKAKALATFKAQVADTNDAHLISHIMSTLHPESTLFLRSTEPSEESPESYRRSLCRVLHIAADKTDSINDVNCMCGKSHLDNFCNHQYNCKGSKDFKISTHNSINKIIVRALKSAEVAVKYEPTKLIRDEITGADRVPDFIVLGHLDDPIYVPGTYGDCMITTTHPMHLNSKQALTPHNRCLYGVKYKLTQYATVSNNHLLVPVVIDSAGHIAPSTMHFLESIFRKISSSNQISFSQTKNYWLKMISCALHQGITADICNIETISRRHNLLLKGSNSTAKHDFLDSIAVHERDSMTDSSAMFERSLRGE